MGEAKQKQMGWEKILSEGHVWVSRMNSAEAKTPVIGWLQHTNIAIAAIVITGILGGSAALAKLREYGQSAATAISRPADTTKEDPRAAMQATGAALDTMLRANIDPASRIAKPVVVTAAVIKDAAPKLLEAASKGEIKTTYTSGPLPEDDIVSVVAGDKVVWLLSKVAPEAEGQRHRIWVAAARNTDDGWKLFSVTGINAPHQTFYVTEKNTVTLSSIPLAVAEFSKAVNGGQK
jgi:hypothetical protein